MERANVRVLIVDDSVRISQLYRERIDGAPDLECIGTLDCADDLIAAAQQLMPDVVVLDLTMPGGDPLACMADLSRQCPDVRVLAFSGYDDGATLDSVLSAGAWGLISKHDDPEAVMQAIRAVAAGEAVVPASPGASLG